MSKVTHAKLIIIGSGPAGWTAAIYAARAMLEPILIRGIQAGGQLTTTTDVENYPGYADGVMGPEMMADFRRQAEKFGAEFLTDDVTSVDFSEQPLRVRVGDDESAGVGDVPEEIDHHAPALAVVGSR